jgi:ribosomal protein S18 acetylase RimI-like enzyme
MEIRRYQEADQAAVWHLHVAALLPTGAYLGEGSWDEDLHHIEEVYLHKRGEFLVGSVDGQVVAMGALKAIDASKAEIKRMRVLSAYQGRSYGQQILTALEARAVELGYKILELDTSVLQVAAQKFYSKNGYYEVRRGKIQNLDCIFYEKQI